jgi:LssY C-terminus
MTPALLSLLFSISTLTNRVTPPGTQLHLRLTSTVGSYASRAGSPLSAVLIAPVTLDGETRLQTGTILSGSVKGVTRVGFGVRHETAGLDLEFNRLTSPEGENIPVFARVAEVDNSRERVTLNGIHGVRSTASLCYRVSGYIRTVLQWEFHAGLAVWAIRSFLMQLPEPEIYYPAGVELTLTLTRPLFLSALLNPEEEVGAQLSDGQRDELEHVVSGLPYRTQAPGDGRLSDLTNVLFIGSRDQVATAFDAAGWTQANPASVRGRITWIRAVAERRGDESAPMSPLLLNGAESDMAWEKGLNDVSKTSSHSDVEGSCDLGRPGDMGWSPGMSISRT